jgi:hypothetical protein
MDIYEPVSRMVDPENFVFGESEMLMYYISEVDTFKSTVLQPSLYSGLSLYTTDGDCIMYNISTKIEKPCRRKLHVTFNTILRDAELKRQF